MTKSYIVTEQRESLTLSGVIIPPEQTLASDSLVPH